MSLAIFHNAFDLVFLNVELHLKIKCIKSQIKNVFHCILLHIHHEETFWNK